MDKFKLIFLDKKKEKEEVTNRELFFEDEISKIYPFAACSQIKKMLKIFRNDISTFKLVTEMAIRTWNETELNFFAESLVQYFLCDPESESPNDPLLERLIDIIDIDLTILKETGSIYDILGNSFTSKVFTQISQLPETRHYITIALRKFYDEIDFEYIDSIDFDEMHRLLVQSEEGEGEEVEEEEEEQKQRLTLRMSHFGKNSQIICNINESKSEEALEALENKRNDQLFEALHSNKFLENSEERDTSERSMPEIKINGKIERNTEAEDCNNEQSVVVQPDHVNLLASTKDYVSGSSSM